MIAEAGTVGREEAVIRAPKLRSQPFRALPNALTLAAVIKPLLGCCIGRESVFTEETGYTVRRRLSALVPGNVERGGRIAQMRLQRLQYGRPVLGVVRLPIRVLTLFTCDQVFDVHCYAPVDW